MRQAARWLPTECRRGMVHQQAVRLELQGRLEKESAPQKATVLDLKSRRPRRARRLRGGRRASWTWNSLAAIREGRRARPAYLVYFFESWISTESASTTSPSADLESGPIRAFTCSRTTCGGQSSRNSALVIQSTATSSTSPMMGSKRSG